jgi:hypothetical protein
MPGVDAVETVTLNQGLYDLRLRYRDTVERSRLHLLWQPPGQETLKAIPSQYLWPSRASAPQSALVDLLRFSASQGWGEGETITDNGAKPERSHRILLDRTNQGDVE